MSITSYILFFCWCLIIPANICTLLDIRIKYSLLVDIFDSHQQVFTNLKRRIWQLFNVLHHTDCYKGNKLIKLTQSPMYNVFKKRRITGASINKTLIAHYICSQHTYILVYITYKSKSVITGANLGRCKSVLPDPPHFYLTHKKLKVQFIAQNCMENQFIA